MSKAYDPIAQHEAPAGLLEKTQFRVLSSDLVSAIAGVDAIIIITRWRLNLSKFLTCYRQLKRKPVVIDGRRDA